MTKQVLFATVCMLMFFNTSAQDGGDFEFGTNVGLNLASVSTVDGLNDTKTRMGLNVGASAEYYFSDNWGLKMKLIYDGKGWADGFIDGEDFGNMTTNFRLNYVSIPVMANWHLGRNRNLYLNFGPYAGLLSVLLTQSWKLM
ncbi:porin family protein [Flagellimonas marina]|uniref:Porin family protein n=1 Tax=Flagellimonas marina TaxID=1775168 RepID=A0ABV8PLX6_9FLAO